MDDMDKGSMDRNRDMERQGRKGGTRVRGVVQIKASLRSSHFGALGQRPTPTTGHNIAFHTLRHVLRPAIREGTRYTFLLFAGWGAQGPWGGTSQISPFLVL